MNIDERPRPRTGAAFTLLELLSVVAILGVLLTLLVPTASRAMETARKGACTANLRTIGSAVQLIVADENGSLPGVGKRTPTSSATWQDVLNLWAFESTGRDPLQRIGEKRQAGKMYCPAMKAWPQGGTRYPRAYVMNTYVPDYSAGTIASYNGIYDYQPGRRMAAFAVPARTVLITESERNGDYISASVPYGQMTLGDGAGAPVWASQNLDWAFRHAKQINVLFLDGHVESRSVDTAKELNDPKFFNPAVQ